MKFLLLLLIPTVSSMTYDLSLAGKCEDSVRVGHDGFSKYFAIPLGNDVKADFESYKLDNANLVYPANSQISEVTISDGMNPLVCYDTEKKSLDGVIYLVTKEFGDMTVYRAVPESVTVQATKTYTVMFSKNTEGISLSDIKTGADTAFTIYSGLPDDSPHLVYTYDSKIGLDQLFIPEPRFFINNTGIKTLNYTFTDRGDSPFDTTFDSKGLILTPGYPKLPADPGYLNMPVKVKPSASAKQLKIKVTTVLAAPEAELAVVLADDTTDGVTISIAGKDECFFPATAVDTTAECSVILPENTNSFKVTSTAAYVVQFQTEDIPTTTPATTTSPSTTTKPTTTTTGASCTPITCSVCPVVTCPTVPPCSCTSSVTTTAPTASVTTELPTTTMGASILSVASIISVSFIYYIL